MSKIEDFFLKWNGVKLDFDKVYGDQCVDVFKQYNQDVVGAPLINGNAVDYWTKYPTDFYDKVENSPTNFPQEGDVVIWGTTIGQYGHIAICTDMANANSFISFDENWPTAVDVAGNDIGVCHFQTHSYQGVLGWLRPKRNLAVVELPQVDDQTIVDLSSLDNATALHETYGVLEVGVIKSKIIAKDQKIADLLASTNQPPQNAPQDPTGPISNPIQPDPISRLVGWLFQIFGANGKK